MDDFVISIVFVILFLIVTFIYVGPSWGRGKTRSSSYPESYGTPLPTEIIEYAINDDNDLDDATKLSIVISLMSERKTVFFEFLKILDGFLALDKDDAFVNNQVMPSKNDINLYITEIDLIISRMRADPQEVILDFNVARTEKHQYLLTALSDISEIRKIYTIVTMSQASMPIIDIQTETAKQSYSTIMNYINSLKTAGYPSYNKLKQEITGYLFDYCVSIIFASSSATQTDIDLLNQLFNKSRSFDGYSAHYHNFKTKDESETLALTFNKLADFFNELKKTSILVSSIIEQETNNLVSTLVSFSKHALDDDSNKTNDIDIQFTQISGKSNITDSISADTESAIPDESVTLFYHSANYRYVYYILSVVIFVGGCYLFFTLPHADWAYVIIASSIAPISYGIEASGMTHVPLIGLANDYFQVEEVCIEYNNVTSIDKSGLITTLDGLVLHIPFKKLSKNDRMLVFDMLQARIKRESVSKEVG